MTPRHAADPHARAVARRSARGDRDRRELHQALRRARRRSTTLDPCTIGRGEVFGLLGPNGAGKTTTILMLLGLTEPTAGGGEVDGLDPTRDPLAVKSRVGYLPDDVGFYDDLTARQNLRYTAELNRIPRRRDRRPHRQRARRRRARPTPPTARSATYSRGMRQRLGLADALVKQPSILILDEPTVNIDPGGRARAAAAGRAAAHRPGRHGAAVVAPAPPGRAGVRPDRHLRQGQARRPAARSTSWPATARRSLGVHGRRRRDLDDPPRCARRGARASIDVRALGGPLDRHRRPRRPRRRARCGHRRRRPVHPSRVATAPTSTRSTTATSKRGAR